MVGRGAIRDGCWFIVESPNDDGHDHSRTSGYHRTSFQQHVRYQVTPRTWPNELRRILDTIARLAAAWNEGDEAGYASHFTDDANYIAASGERYTGKAQIRTGYGWLFTTSLRGSRISLEIESIRSWSPVIALVTLRVRLETPDDTVDGRHALIRSSLLMFLAMDGWRVAALHGTRIADRRCASRRPPSMWTRIDSP